MIADVEPWRIIARTNVKSDMPWVLPHRYVLRHAETIDKDGSHHEYVVHTQLMSDESFHNGHYTDSFINAVKVLKNRASEAGLKIK